MYAKHKSFCIGKEQGVKQQKILANLPLVQLKFQENHEYLCTLHLTFYIYNYVKRRTMNTENDMRFWQDDMSALQVSFERIVEFYSDRPL